MFTECTCSDISMSSISKSISLVKMLPLVRIFLHADVYCIWTKQQMKCKTSDLTFKGFPLKILIPGLYSSGPEWKKGLAPLCLSGYLTANKHSFRLKCFLHLIFNNYFTDQVSKWTPTHHRLISMMTKYITADQPGLLAVGLID